MDQLIDQLSLTEDEVTQHLSIAEIAPNMTVEQALARDMILSSDISNEHLQLIFDTIACGIVLINSAGQIVEANRAAEQVLGVNFEAMQQYLFASDHIVFRHPDGTPLPYEELQVAAVFRTGQAQHRALEGFTRPDGQIRWIEIDAAPARGEDNTITHAVVTFVDVTERIKAEQVVQASEERFRALTEQSNDLMTIVDNEGRFRYVSSSCRRILGYEPEELLVASLFSLIHSDDLPHIMIAFADCLGANGATVRAEGRMRHANGSWLMVEGFGHNCPDDPAIQGMVITIRDITERVAAEDARRYQTRHDGLTGLPNSMHFIETLGQDVIAAQREQRAMAVLVLDINRFKDINDTFGQQHGDLLLQQVGMSLRNSLPADDMVSRFNGDQFAIRLLSADEAQARAVASAIQCVLEEPCLIDGYPIQIDVSIGAALYPQHASEATALLRCANTAMYTAKQTHEGYTLFESDFEQCNPHRLALVGGLRRAIGNGELRLYYQPKIDLKSRTVRSVEALVRWQHPTHGLVPPDQFISLAEQTGLIVPLTRWVLEEAIRQCGEWLRTGHKLSVAVNLSAWNLRDVTLSQTIAELLERFHVPPRSLCIELTESAMMTDIQRSLDTLAHIFDLGVSISIDDFGTGYSSLANLKRLQVDELKIDRSFVQQMTSSRTDMTIVRSTVNLAHSFGIRVVAEGVEDRAALDMLATFHCDIAQGYYISRPLPAAEFERWLSSSSSL